MKNVWKLTRFLWLNMRLPFLLKLVCSAVTAFFVPASLMCLGRLADAAVGYIQGSDINSVYPYLAVFVVIQSAADRVIFLEQGRIAADGPHDVLMRTNPSYRRFYEAQSKWYQSGIIR